MKRSGEQRGNTARKAMMLLMASTLAVSAACARGQEAPAASTDGGVAITPDVQLTPTPDVQPAPVTDTCTGFEASYLVYSQTGRQVDHSRADVVLGQGVAYAHHTAYQVGNMALLRVTYAAPGYTDAQASQADQALGLSLDNLNADIGILDTTQDGIQDIVDPTKLETVRRAITPADATAVQPAVPVGQAMIKYEVLQPAGTCS